MAAIADYFRSVDIRFKTIFVDSQADLHLNCGLNTKDLCTNCFEHDVDEDPWLVGESFRQKEHIRTVNINLRYFPVVDNHLEKCAIYGIMETRRQNTIDEKGNNIGDQSADPGKSNNSTNPSDSTSNWEKQSLNQPGEEQGHLINVTNQLKDKKNHEIKGLLYVGSLKTVPPTETGDYYVVCNAFWKEDAVCSPICSTKNFDFLENFSVMNSPSLLEKLKGNYMNLEVWKKTENEPEPVGVATLPLHQFYIAFRDPVLSKHLGQLKLPVISVDGYTDMFKSHVPEPCGQVQVILAMGTEPQVQELKGSRNLGDYAGKQTSTEVVAGKCSGAANQIATNRSIAMFPPRRERLSDLLGTFIDGLAQKLASDRQQALNVREELCVPVQGTELVQPYKTNIRRTADLLDTLEKALYTPPLTSSSPSEMSEREIIPDFFKISLEVECGRNLPRNPICLANKKCKKAKSNKFKNTKFPADEEPNCYVTFQAKENSEKMIKSHEGMVFATNVIERTCDPTWNSKFELEVAADFFKNTEKPFVLKVWRKATNGTRQDRLVPKPTEDAMLGFAKVDLSVLSTQSKSISDWFDVVDFNDRVNGQIKLNFEPLDNIGLFFNTDVEDLGDYDKWNSSEAECGNTPLSRAIKRKFTELEEITERLKTRLSDVTSELHNEEDITDEQLEEFEKDLNTACEEEHEITGIKDWCITITPTEQDATINETQQRIESISHHLEKTEINDTKISTMESEKETDIQKEQNEKEE